MTEELRTAYSIGLAWLIVLKSLKVLLILIEAGICVGRLCDGKRMPAHSYPNVVPALLSELLATGQAGQAGWLAVKHNTMDNVKELDIKSTDHTSDQ